MLAYHYYQVCTLSYPLQRRLLKARLQEIYNELLPLVCLHFAADLHSQIAGSHFDLKINSLLNSTVTFEEFIECVFNRRSRFDEYNSIINTILENERKLNYSSIKLSSVFRFSNAFTMQYFDWSVANEILQQLLLYFSALDIHRDDNKHKDSISLCLNHAKENFVNFMLHSLFCPPLHKSVQILPFNNNVVYKSLRWINSIIPRPAVHTAESGDFGSSSTSQLIAAPLGLSFRGNWNGALVALRKFQLSQCHHAISISAKHSSGSRHEILMHSNRVLHWLGVQTLTTKELSAEHLQYLHLPIAISFGKDETSHVAASGESYNVAYVVRQLAPERSLQDAFFTTLSTPISLNPAEKMSIILDVAKGLSILHSKGMAHGRLKPSNVLLFRGQPKLRAKISDFGLHMSLTLRERALARGEDAIRWTGDYYYYY